jgi:hypothetical protein
LFGFATSPLGHPQDDENSGKPQLETHNRAEARFLMCDPDLIQNVSDHLVSPENYSCVEISPPCQE